MKFLYRIFVFLLEPGFRFLALFNDKIKRGLEGRAHSLGIVKAAISKEDKVLWMHAASLGEYEQGLPVVEQLKQQFPNYKVLVTFFSPSGYENVVKKQHIADAVCYLPFDTQKNISAFVEAAHPDIFFSVKYDFWYHLLDALKNQKTKVFVVSALFYEKQSYFKFYGKWFAKELRKNVDWFFHQTSASFALAQKIGLKKSSVSGDTRFDRVKQIAASAEVEHIEAFKYSEKVIVFGSSWEAEEKIALLLSQKLKGFKIILAPHELKRVAPLKKMFPKAVLYSEIVKSQNPATESETLSPFRDLTTSPILIIDSIGLLSKLYRYADVAVVGGGFHDKGLHNILEPAAYGIPVFFGNRYRKNPEADALISRDGAQSFGDETAAADFIVELCSDSKKLLEMGKNAGDFIHQQPEASAIIIQKIREEI